jgi:tetratricopeptide (TPR) repeat protein
MEYDGFYTMRVLGAAGADLGILAHFFTALWVTLVPGLPQNYQGMLFNEAAIRLRALGRLTEAVQPMRLAGESLTAQGDWKNAAAALKNYCELELARGETSAALAAGEQATTHADRTGIITLKISMRTVLADVLHQIGRRDDSLRLFKTAEAIQASHYPTYPNLGSMSGFQYCDILLSEAERSIWRHLLFNETIRSRVPLEDIVRRARRSLRWTSKESGDQLSIAFDHITMARANLYKRPSDALALQEAITHVDSAVNVLRKMSRINYLPQALLIRSLLRFFSRHEQGCLEDLAQAWDISERGPMPLYQADILLYRARLFRDRAALAEARRLIEKHGYHRRDEELADAEAAAVNWKDKEPSMPTKTFISYSHDSEQHSQRVLALANQLRAQGVDAEIDQYETRPSQGWPRWCEEQLRPENSELVLVVCTETYLKRIENKVSADEGMGVFWEGGIIYSYLYDEKDTERFLPVIFDSKDGAYIPRPLKGATRFVLSKFDFSDSGYSALYRELTHQPTVQKPPLGEVVRMRGGFSLSVEGEDDVNVLPPVEPKRVRSVFPSTAAAPAETDPLEELKTLPAAWFDELVYRFDEHNAVSARPAPQSTRAIDLLNVVRVMEDGLARLREEIRRLKASE